MGRWQSTILVEASPRVGQHLAGQGNAALRLGLQEVQTLRRRVLEEANYIVTAHRHVAMILPAKALDGRAIAAAVRVDPFRRVDLAKIA